MTPKTKKSRRPERKRRARKRPGKLELGGEPRRPPFADSYPRNAELDRLVEAFEMGNFGLVRTEAPRIAERTEDDAVRDAARDLLRRIHPDPAAIYLLLIGVALVIFLYGYYLSTAP